jgi:SAM-dependent methyltransferase
LGKRRIHPTGNLWTFVTAMSAREREIAGILAREDRSDRFQAVLSLIKTPVFSILDLGCGIGSLASLLAERFPSASILGIDKSRYLLEQFRCKGMRPNILEAQAEMPIFPLKPETFDLAVAVQVMHEVFHFKGKPELISTIKSVHDLLREGGEFIVLDHRNPGDAAFSVRLPRETLGKLHHFRLRFKPRKISYQILDKGWISISMRDFYDFVTKIWAMDTSLEEEEMHETHTPFTEQEFARFCQKAGFRITSLMSLTSIDSYLEHYKILVKTNLKLPERHFIVVATK